jgi:hypothetical protein
MEDFANQLANLQRAATRASSSSDNTSNGIVNGSGINRSSNDDVTEDEAWQRILQ